MKSSHNYLVLVDFLPSDKRTLHPIPAAVRRIEPKLPGSLTLSRTTVSGNKEAHEFFLVRILDGLSKIPSQKHFDYICVLLLMYKV